MNDIINICDKIEYLVGNKDYLINIDDVPALPCFSEDVISFLDDLSKKLRKDESVKTLIDVQTYAFWIRKSSIEKEKQNHPYYENRIGRGVAFHIAPSNVPVNFAVSMTSSLLAGNACIIRVSNKEFSQVNVICDAINDLLKDKYRKLRKYFLIIRYEHNDEITEVLSNHCDVRVIWGGNATINKIRLAKLPPRAIEMAFADRYSIAIINADEYLKLDSKAVAGDFYTDTYYSDQNACSSPRLVAWIGTESGIAEAKGIFWKEISELAKINYKLHEIQVVDKLDRFCILSAKAKAISESLSIKKIVDNNFLYRIEVNELYSELFEYKEAGGYFFEYNLSSLEDIIPILKKKCQTIALLGIPKEDMKDIVMNYGTKGVDRIVEVGKTMELSFIWDGYDMIETMSRIVNY